MIISTPSPSLLICRPLPTWDAGSTSMQWQPPDVLRFPLVSCPLPSRSPRWNIRNRGRTLGLATSSSAKLHCDRTMCPNILLDRDDMSAPCARPLAPSILEASIRYSPSQVPSVVGSRHKFEIAHSRETRRTAPLLHR